MIFLVVDFVGQEADCFLGDDSWQVERESISLLLCCCACNDWGFHRWDVVDLWGAPLWWRLLLRSDDDWDYSCRVVACCLTVGAWCYSVSCWCGMIGQCGDFGSVAHPLDGCPTL